MRRGVASLRDDGPGASAKGAKGAEGDRLVVQIEVVSLDDGVVALVLPGGVCVGGETTFHSRLVGWASAAAKQRHQQCEWRSKPPVLLPRHLPDRGQGLSKPRTALQSMCSTVIVIHTIAPATPSRWASPSLCILSWPLYLIFLFFNV